MALPKWSPKSPKWTMDTYCLLHAIDISEPPKQSLEDIIQKSENFSVKFPVETGRCKTLKQYVSQSILERNINSVYPIIHENVLEFYCKFILYKRAHGTSKEKSLYQEMSLLEFINRLLTKRAVMFLGKDDKYLLLTGEKGSKGWESIGTEDEKPPLLLENCISYDEIKLSAFLSVSSYTYFVNLGDRKNMAKYSDERSGIQEEGIIIGLIGTRLKKQNVMEYQELVISPKYNNNKNGYGSGISDSMHKLFSELYEEPCMDYFETLNHKKVVSGRYTEIPAKSLFDNHVYYKRLLFSIDTLLMEANYRAKQKETTAYIHVVGIGLGVWRISLHQDQIYMDAFARRIKLLGDKLQSISDICFSYIDQQKCGKYKHGEIFPIKTHPKTGIKIHIFRREPHAKLVNDDAGKLLVVSYAWDGNALPGNEYWSGKLGSSGDSAAASSTQITEIQNPHINPLVNANNLRIVTKDDVVTLKKYQEIIRGNLFKRRK